MGMIDVIKNRVEEENMMIKKYVRYAILALCGILVTACGKKQEEPRQSITLMASQLEQSSDVASWECGYRDLTHDGIVDKIMFEITAISGNTEVESLLRASEVGHICVYRGLDEVGNYEEQPLWKSQDVAWASHGNVQISVVEKNGEQYLLISEISEHQGEANYGYRVFSLDEQGQEVIRDAYEVAFAIAEEEVTEADKEERNATVPAFREKISIWFESAVLLVATDINTEQVIFVSDFENGGYVSPEYYYQHVWSRMSVTVTDTTFETTYFKFNMPKEWVGKYTFSEEENGKQITFYHKATADKGELEGIFGYIFLCNEEEAIELQEHAGAYYVTEPIETEEGTMMGLALQPHDVQFEEEDYEEYCMLSDYFTYKKIAQCVSVKGSQNEESIFSVISKLEQPMGQLELAVPGQPLVGYLYQDTVQEQHIFYDCLLQGEYEAVPTLMIDGKDYTDVIKSSTWLSEGAANKYLYLNWYGIFDIDINDGMRELAISDQGVSGDPVIHFFQYDGENLTFVGDMEILSSTESFQVKGDGTIDAVIRVWYPENNEVQTVFRLQDGKLTEVPQERYELGYQNTHQLLEALLVYEKMDKTSQQIELKAGVDSVNFIAYYNENWVELTNGEGKTYYLYLDLNQLEDGRYIDNVVADLYRAG